MLNDVCVHNQKLFNVLLININYRHTSTGFSSHWQYLFQYTGGKDKSIWWLSIALTLH